MGQISIESREIPVPDTMVSQVHLLDDCNLRCKHCYVGNYRFKPRPMPSLTVMKERIKRIAEFSKHLGFEEHVMNISGGEPTLRKDLIEIIREIVSRDIEPLLLTNGINFNRDLAAEIKDAGCDKVQISLEGIRDFNDRIRGLGSYEKAVKAVRDAKDEGYTITLGVTVNKLNISDFKNFVDEFEGVVDRFHVSELTEIGAGVGLRKLDEKERFGLYDFARFWKGKTTIFIEDPTYCSIGEELIERRAGCGAFICLLCVDVDGSIYPCRKAPVKMGTIDDLEGAWFSDAGKRLRVRDFEGKCGKCHIKGSCGGCRAYAATTGNILGSDDRCYINKPEFLTSASRR